MKKCLRSVMDLEKYFPTEEACRDHLFRLRWPRGFVCPRCQKRESWTASRERLICQECRHQTSVTAGTLFQDTHKPLTLWFRAIWHVVCLEADATTLQQVLKLGSYKTAWTWWRKLRPSDRLTGTVDVATAYLELCGKDTTGQRADNKVLIAIATEQVKGAGVRVRIRRILDTSQDNLYGFIKEVIKPGSTVRTDGLDAYLSMDGYVLQQQVKRHHIDSVAWVLNRNLRKRYTGAIDYTDLDDYLEAFALQQDRPTSCSRKKLFDCFLQRAVRVDPVPYRCIIGGKNDSGSQRKVA